MIENQAYIVALMLLIASPIAIASDEGQAVLERFSNTPDDLVDVEKNDRTEGLDDLLKEDILNDRPIDEMDTKDVVEDCYTLEQWKERLADYDWNKEDWERESNEVREEDGARGNSDDKKEKEDYNKETDKVTDKATDKDCFTEAEFEEFVVKMGNDERKDKEDCVTIADFRDRLEEIREGDRVWDEDDEDDRDEESDEERDNDEDEGARGEDEEESDADHDLNDEEKAELFAAIGELKEACMDGDEAACVELRELLEEFWGDWERDQERDWEQKDRDDSRCINKHMVDHMKEKFGRDRGHKDYDRDWNRDQDWERDDDKECDERDEDDENDHDEDDEDDSEDEEDDSENDEPENA